ncbi:3,4-dihydroxy-2-butanone-4-phosphate synthase [Brevibacterium sp. 5221]|uniref:GTP cyclohydrolase-2 n=1 Tax=Brevibacterium rongguiense TaxID=2695267 RepID=A0A6N9H5P3_9MICO|nr:MULTISPECIES: 3,4-dihydroxy-2-butanone-4-phosphate synthase [Brevibacterium]MYM19390.1 3,4-dihydroxy-2-butanone-4-phosphate synthase [Brevibacterium rongguiense]WAL39314.1 3,4-dihydroxy-2-butanone-4-phosphate synthase [Brevibacterium sp. BRM-1]
MTRSLAAIDAAIAQLAAGRPVIVVDDEDRENEGDLIMPAEHADAAWMGFMVRHTSGVVCAPMTPERAAQLRLPAMVQRNEDPKGTAYTVSCDAAVGTTTGISAADRARTAAVLADPAAGPGALSRPGHVFPLIARPGGVRERAGHTEAGVELARLAGCAPVAVIAELVHDDGSMMRLPALLAFGAAHGLLTVSIADLAAWLDTGGAQVRQAAEAGRAAALVDAPVPEVRVPEVRVGEAVRLPTAHGEFRARACSEPATGTEHLVLEAPGASGAAGAQGASGTAPLVRVHSECLTGDVLGSRRCDCGEQLDAALARLGREGGCLVYLRGHEGRGIGLANKLRAYRLQEEGLDTVDANTALGLPADARDYAAAAGILRLLGIARVRLLTNNPAKARALDAHGIEVLARVPIAVPARTENAVYLDAKRTRMHHDLPADGPQAQTPTSAGQQSGAERKVS